MANNRLGIVALASGLGLGGVLMWQSTSGQCDGADLTLSTTQRCFKVRAAPFLITFPLPVCVGGRATYRLSTAIEDNEMTESLECLSELNRIELQSEIDAYFIEKGLEADSKGAEWWSDDATVRYKILGVVGGPAALKVTYETNL